MSGPLSRSGRAPSPRRGSRAARPHDREVARLERELQRVRDELRQARSAPPRHDGLLVSLARVVQSGFRGLSWESLARLQAALYFAWHAEDVDEFGHDPVFADTIAPFFEFLYSTWWRVEADGIQNLPDQGPALVVANHSGVLPYDGAMIKLAIRHQHPARRECRMLMLDMFALLPFLAPALTKHGEIRANPDNAERVLASGGLVGVFPEGIKGVGKRFKDRYRLARFGRGGFVRIALRTGAPIIPCAVVGAEEIHPIIARADWIGRPLGFPYFPLTPTFPWLGPLGFVPLPSKWSIEFADPIPTEGYGEEAADDPILVNRISEETRRTIQKIIDGRLARRRSVWFG
ncbi:MAG TPA: lysophospholipid acyltransferase family protein [Vicinamibacteria bacterium]|nr:lysophospholipid acyltransferase family protein [Vicinamibacteria bacterium]